MTARTPTSYSVAEVEALRQAVEQKYLFGAYRPHRLFPGSQLVSRTYIEPEKTVVVEERVRTHMLAGHTAEDLYQSEEGSCGR